MKLKTTFWKIGDKEAYKAYLARYASGTLFVYLMFMAYSRGSKVQFIASLIMLFFNIWLFATYLAYIKERESNGEKDKIPSKKGEEIILN